MAGPRETKTTTRKKTPKPKAKAKKQNNPRVTLVTKEFKARLELADKLTKSTSLVTSTIVFDSDVLTIYAGTRNGGVVVKMPHDSKIDEPYTVSIDISELTAIVKSLAGELVELENDVDHDCIRLYSSSFKTKFQHFDGIVSLDSFDLDHNRTDTQKEEDPVQTIEVDAKQFVTSVLKTSYCVPTAEYQAVFRAVSIADGASGNMELVTTDGFRIAVCSTDNTSPEYPLTPVGKTLDLVAGMLEQEGSIYLSYTNSHIQLEQNEYRFIIPQLEGEYPNWEKVANKFKLQVTVTFNTEQLMDAIGRAKLKTQGHKRMDLSYDGDGVVKLLGMGDSGTIESEEPLEVVVTGQDKLPFRRGFNYQYFEQAIDDSNVLTSVSLGTEPDGICQFFSEDDSIYKAHVVPLRIEESL